MPATELWVINALEVLLAAALGWYGFRVRRLSADGMERGR